MSEPPVDPAPFVTAAQLAAFLKLTADGPEATSDQLAEVLGAALEVVEYRIGGPLVSASRQYPVRANGRHLVLPVTHLTAVAGILDPAGLEVPIGQVDVNLLSGIVTLPTVAQIGTYTVSATAREHGDALRLAVKIIASHLYGTVRGSDEGGSRFARPVGDVSPVRMGFAIPARAAELIAPFVPIGGFA